MGNRYLGISNMPYLHPLALAEMLEYKTILVKNEANEKKIFKEL